MNAFNVRCPGCGVLFSIGLSPHAKGFLARVEHPESLCNFLERPTSVEWLEKNISRALDLDGEITEITHGAAEELQSEFIRESHKPGKLMN